MLGTYFIAKPNERPSTGKSSSPETNNDESSNVAIEIQEKLIEIGKKDEIIGLLSLIALPQVSQFSFKLILE